MKTENVFCISTESRTKSTIVAEGVRLNFGCGSRVGMLNWELTCDCSHLFVISVILLCIISFSKS